jgi:hypothetical protein
MSDEMRMIMYYLISSNHSANTCLNFCNYNSNFLSAQNPAVHLNKSSQTWNINHMWFVVSISPFRLLILDHLQYSTLPVYHKSDCVYPIQLLNKRPAMSDTFVEPHTLAHICQQFANLINSYLMAPVPSSFSNNSELQHGLRKRGVFVCPQDPFRSFSIKHH